MDPAFLSLLFTEGEPQPDNLPPFFLLVGLLFMMVVCLICAVVALVIWRRRKTQTERGKRTQDQTTTPNTHILQGNKQMYVLSHTAQHRKCGLTYPPQNWAQCVQI